MLFSVTICSESYGAPGDSAADPILISNPDGLYAIRTKLGSLPSPVYYRQTADINLSGYPNWQPIGTLATPAYVHYDGANHKILNLTLSRSEPNVGLFGHLSGSVGNLTLESGSVTGNANVGALAGFLNNGTISNCLSKVVVSGSTAGGLAGWNQGGTLRRVSVRAATISGSTYSGGLVGYNAGGALFESFSAAAVSGSSSVGGVAGHAGSGASVTSCYWDAWVSPTATSAAGGIGLTTPQMQQRGSFSGWDFTTVWQLYSGKSYPYLQAQAEDVLLPVLSPGGGAYPGASMTVTVTCGTPDATIHYVIGRTAPSDQTTSTIISGERVSVPIGETLNTVAWVRYMNPSAVSAATYTPAPPADKPTADQPAGEYPGTNLNVVLSSATSNSTIHYTTNGDNPSETSASVASGGSVAVPIPSILKARTYRSDLNPSDLLAVTYTNAPPVVTPGFNPDGGAHPGSNVAVTISCATDGAMIRYTTDGSEPTELSDGSTSTIVVMVPVPGTLMARAFHPDLNPSAIRTAVYSKAAPVATPVFEPNGGTFAGSSVTVTMTCATAGAVIRYTTNGNDPSEASSGATSGASVSVPVRGTLKARAYKSGWNPSEIKTALYENAANTAMPTFNPDAGPIPAGNVKVTVDSTTPGAIIRYTTDGSDPTETSASGLAGMMVPVPVPGTLKAKAWADGLNPSAIKSASYTTAGVVVTPTFSPDGGTGGGTVSVTLACATPSAAIHYTLDGSEPVEGSQSVIPGVPVVVSLPSTLKAKAYATGLFSSPVKTAYYGDFAGGSGTAQDPYRIATALHLDQVRNHLWAHFVLIDDIDLAPWNSGEGWLPIDDGGNGFVGSFDGGGHVVSNLYIVRPTADYMGLFGYVGASGRIINLGIRSGSVSGKNYTGGLAGTNKGTVSNTFAQCAVLASSSYAGGLLGSADPRSLVADSYASGAVTSMYSWAGGLIGIINGSVIHSSYAVGAVGAPSVVGGLIGQSLSGDPVGCYWDTQTSGVSGSDGGTGMVTTNMQKQSTFAGWDFADVWRIDEGVDYPRLRVFDPATLLTPPDDWLIRFYGSVEAAPETSVKDWPLSWEYVAGTDPTDPESLFAVTTASSETNTLSLSVNSSTGRVYSLLSRGSLSAGDWQAVSGVAEQPGTGGPLEFTLPAPGGPAFYRLGVRLAE